MPISNTTMTSLTRQFNDLFGDNAAIKHLQIYKPDGRRVYTVYNILGITTRCFTAKEFYYWMEGARDYSMHMHSLNIQAIEVKDRT